MIKKSGECQTSWDGNPIVSSIYESEISVFAHLGLGYRRDIRDTGLYPNNKDPELRKYTTSLLFP